MNQTVPTTILIADDDPSHLMLAEAALAGAGFVVHTASDGQEAVERFPDVKPDVVVLDVMMPRMTGIEACREIRRGMGSQFDPQAVAAFMDVADKVRDMLAMLRSGPVR